MGSWVARWMFYLLFCNVTNLLKLCLCCFLHLFHLRNIEDILRRRCLRNIFSLCALSWTLRAECYWHLVVTWQLRNYISSPHAVMQTLTAVFRTGLAFSAFLMAVSNSTSLQVLLKSISFIEHINCTHEWLFHRFLSSDMSEWHFKNRKHTFSASW